MPNPQHPTRRLSPSILIKNAFVVHGSGRGKGLGIPTINIEPSAIPKELEHGIYACWIKFSGKQFQGAVHYGPRPVFKDCETFEVHVLDATIDSSPLTVDIDIIGKIREIKDFPSVKALKEAIAADIAIIRSVLSSNG